MGLLRAEWGEAWMGGVEGGGADSFRERVRLVNVGEGLQRRGNWRNLATF